MREEVTSTWSVEFLDRTVTKEFKAFPAAIRAQMIRQMELIEEFGLDNLSPGVTKHLQGKIWEIRVRDKDTWGRSLYCALSGKKIVILRCFLKKTNKTPRHEINLALERMKKSNL